MKKQTNKRLVIVLILLVALFAATKIFRSPALESNLDKDVFHVDTAAVATIKFQHEGDSALTLKKSQGRWTVAQKSRSAAAEAYQVRSLLQTLATLQPERMVSRKKEKWSNYQVGDSASFRLTAYNDAKKEIADWHVGKSSAGATYLRTEGDAEVYAVEGNLRSKFDKAFNAWRDKTFLHVNKNLIEKIDFRYPADSGFVLEKKAGAWMIDGRKADSVKVANYVARLQSKDLTHFADDFSETRDPDITLSIEGSALQEVIKGWKGDGKNWVLSSTAQKDAYFSDSTFVRDLFVGKNALTGK